MAIDRPRDGRPSARGSRRAREPSRRGSRKTRARRRTRGPTDARDARHDARRTTTRRARDAGGGDDDDDAGTLDDDGRARARARGAGARVDAEISGRLEVFGDARRADARAGAFRNAPEPQTEEEEGSVLDFPEEYQRAVPSRRPDIFPDLKEPKTPMPRPMPGDPEMPGARRRRLVWSPC